MSAIPAQPAVPPEYAQAMDRLAPMAAAALHDLPQRDWLVPDVFPAGDPAVIGGPPKSFKTSIACDLAVSLATANPFLNHFPVPRPRRTWLISGEVGQHALRNQLARVAGLRRLDLTQLPNLAWSASVPALDRPRDVAAVADHLRRCGIEAVVLDPLYLALAGVSSQVSNLFAVGPLLHAFATACRAAGATPVIVHHTVKKSGRKATYTELTDLTQSGVGEFVRAWLLINKVQDAEKDDGDERPDVPGVYALTLNVGGSAGHSSRWSLDLDVRAAGGGWQVCLRPPSQAPGGTASVPRPVSKRKARTSSF